MINGNETVGHAEDDADTHVFDYAGQANEQWTVNVADGDQRTMTVAEIVDRVSQPASSTTRRTAGRTAWPTGFRSARSSSSTARS